MILAILSFLFLSFISVVLLFTMVYNIIMFSDLEMDYINPIDVCKKINIFIIPEMLIHAFVCFILIISFRLRLFLFNIPLLVFNVMKFREGRYLLEATDVFRQVPQRKKITFIKLGFYLISFFIYLFTMASLASSKV